MTRDIPGNPHAYVATYRLTETPRPRLRTIAAQIHFGFDALTQAALALAYEKRTENLIALATYSAEVGRRELGDPSIEEVSRRLGMEGD